MLKTLVERQKITGDIFSVFWVPPVVVVKVALYPILTVEPLPERPLRQWEPSPERFSSERI